MGWADVQGSDRVTLDVDVPSPYLVLYFEHMHPQYSALNVELMHILHGKTVAKFINFLSSMHMFLYKFIGATSVLDMIV